MACRVVWMSTVSMAAVFAANAAQAQTQVQAPAPAPVQSGTSPAESAVTAVQGDAAAPAPATQDAATQDAAADAAPAQAEPAAPAGDIVVTGSRIVSAGFNAPTPVSVLQTGDLIRKAPSNLSDALNQLPVFQNSVNANQQQFTQGNRQRTGNYLNLRALGTQRVLVLQDFQRLPPSGTNGGVDASLIPQLLTERVDIVTGGASAVYGSDAVSGVVNFVINKRLTGLRAQFQRGITSDGTNGSYRAGLAGGFGLLDDRFHLIASAERYHSDGLKKGDKPIIGRLIQSAGTGTAANPFRYVDGVRYNNATDGGYVQTGPATIIGRQFAPNGSLIPFNTGLAVDIPGEQRFGDGSFLGDNCCTITPSQTANQLFARAQYETDDGVTVFVSGGYNFSNNADRPFPILRLSSTVFRDNPYLTPATLAALGTAASFNIGRVANDAPGLRIEQKSDSFIINAGVDGKIGALKWNLGYTRGRTTFQSDSQDVLNQNFYAAADPVRDAGGNIVCRVSVTNPGLYPGCVPLNLIGAGNISEAAYNYIVGVSTYRAVNKLDSFQANISGDLFRIWGGPVSFAIGGEYRRQSLSQTSNSDPSIPTSFTGLRGVMSNASLKFFAANNGVARGSYEVKEAFVELNAPLFKNTAIGSLELNGAARVTDYSTSGSVTTWKVGGIYDPVDGIRLRATLSRDIRAPTLFELFAGQTSNSITFADRLTGVQAMSRQISGGNPNLTPEIAKTFTGGIVLRPSFLPGFNFSADYFNIRIKDAIATPFSAFQIVDLCFASGGTSPLCDQIIRPLGPTNTSTANIPTAVLTNNQNLSNLDLSGIDLEARYAFDLGGGRVTARALGTRQITFEQTTAPGQPLRKFAGTADFNDAQFPVVLPKWRGTFDLTYEIDGFTISAQERVVGGYERSRLLVYAENNIRPVWYTDLNASIKVPGYGGDMEFFVTANNLFNRQPPIIPVTRTPGLTVPTIRSAYDIVGRYLTFGVRARF